MAGKERINLIKKIIRTDKKVSVSELSIQFGVTEETIRRDLEKLEAEGILTRTFGGAVLNMESHRENIDFYQRSAIHTEEKRRMARAFANILQDKYTLAVDGSSTVMEVVKLLEDNADMTVLTPSQAVLNELSHTKFNLICTGGIYNRNSLCLHGSMAIENIKRYHVELALLSCKGISLEEGATDSKVSEAEVKRAMMEQAAEVALFADHTKFGKTAFAQLLQLKEIHYLVTDKKPEKKCIDYCAKNGIKLIYPQ